MKILAHDGKHKIQDKWEEDPYIIIEQPNKDIPVFVVQKEGGEGRKRTLHRNVLLPIGSLFETDDRPVPKPRKKPQPKPRKTRLEESYSAAQPVSDSEDSVVVTLQRTEDNQMSDDDRRSDMRDNVYEDAHSLQEETLSQPEEHEDEEHEDEEIDEDEEDEDDQEEEDVQAVNTAPVSESDSDDHETVPIPPPRPVRTRRPPQWIRDNQYVMSVTSTDWEKRVNVLQSMLQKDLPLSLQERITETILSIIKQSD